MPNITRAIGRVQMGSFCLVLFRCSQQKHIKKQKLPKPTHGNTVTCVYTLICNIHSVTWKNRLRLYSDRQIKAIILMSPQDKGPCPHLWPLGFKAIFFKKYISIFFIFCPISDFACLINYICARVHHADNLAVATSPTHLYNTDFLHFHSRVISSGLHFGLMQRKI